MFLYASMVLRLPVETAETRLENEYTILFPRRFFKPIVQKYK